MALRYPFGAVDATTVLRARRALDPEEETNEIDAPGVQRIEDCGILKRSKRRHFRVGRDVESAKHHDRAGFVYE